MKKILKQPLVHFLLIGLSFFLLFQWVSGGDPGDARTIVVNKDVLMTHLQYRSKAFNQEIFEKKLAEMPEEELQQMIDDYVREEVLYREAMAMGLDKEDYIIKRRMIQKVEFISQGIAENTQAISEEEVKRYYEENMEDYFIQPFVTFTHVFFDRERLGREKAGALARTKLSELNQEKVNFADGVKHGSRFLYHVNYDERTLDFVTSHFGKEMAEQLFRLNPSKSIWRGPYNSPYGSHLAMLVARQKGRLSPLDEVRARVQSDARRALIRERTENAVRKIVESYTIVNRLSPPATTGSVRAAQ